MARERTVWWSISEPLMRKEVDRSAMIRLFEEIRDAFPRLSMRLDQNPRHVDLDMDIPEQPGLTFGILQNVARR